MAMYLADRTASTSAPVLGYCSICGLWRIVFV